MEKCSIDFPTPISKSLFKTTDVKLKTYVLQKRKVGDREMN